MSKTEPPKPVRSMTGYARLRKMLPAGELTVTVKSVNHRSLDMHFHLPEDIDFVEPSMRAVLRERLTRGHIDIRASFARVEQQGDSGLNIPLFHAYRNALKQAAGQMRAPEPEPDLNSLLRLPGMVQITQDVEPDAEFESRVLEVLREAADLLDNFRVREGRQIADVILRHNRDIQQHAAEMEEIRSRAVPALQARLTERLRELLRGVALDPQRLAQEVALLVDRSDVGEEIERLKIHSAHLSDLLVRGGEVGKRLDFLLQEMNRESNTVLSKTNGIGELGLKMTELALSAKADIEKIREHALNLE